MSKLTPIIKICTYNKPCRFTKMYRNRNKGKTHLYKLCRWKGMCNQQELVAANTAGEPIP